MDSLKFLFFSLPNPRKRYIKLQVRKKQIRIGFIIPSSNTTAEPELTKLTARESGITLHFTRIPLSEITPGTLNRMLHGLRAAARLLADASCDATCFACTSASFLKGKKGMRKISQVLKAESKAPSISTSEAVLISLQALQSRRLALISPYISELNADEVDFLEESLPGLQVVATRSFGMISNLEIGMIPINYLLKVSKELIKEVNPDTIFFSCTNMPTLEAIEPLEQKFGIHVFSSNTASLFAILHVLNWKTKIEGAGRLFSRLSRKIPLTLKP